MSITAAKTKRVEGTHAGEKARSEPNWNVVLHNSWHPMSWVVYACVTPQNYTTGVFRFSVLLTDGAREVGFEWAASRRACSPSRNPSSEWSHYALLCTIGFCWVAATLEQAVLPA